MLKVIILAYIPNQVLMKGSVWRWGISLPPSPITALLPSLRINWAKWRTEKKESTHNWYKIVVLPALSKPTIMTLCSEKRKKTECSHRIHYLIQSLSQTSHNGSITLTAVMTRVSYMDCHPWKVMTTTNELASRYSTRDAADIMRNRT